MAANRIAARRPSRSWLIAPTGLAGLALIISAASWWLTAPLDDGSASPGRAPAEVVGPVPDVVGPTVTDRVAEPDWPAGTLDGRPAKRFLLGFMERAVDQLDGVAGYTATLTRQERIDGTLGPEQRLRIKIQHEPFAVYLRFESPKPGKEALYHAGRFDDHVLAHNGDWTRRLIPRFQLDPLGPIALAENRHPITEAGLENLSRKLLHFRRVDLDDPHAETVLDRTTDEDGRLWYRSRHSHAVNDDGARPFCYVEIRYCPELLLPLHIISYDWPAPGADDDQPLQLAERYRYDDVDLDAAFSAIDFDPANPEYGFQRY